MALIGCLIPSLHEMSMIVFERKRIGGIQVYDSNDDDSEYQQIEDDIGSCHSATLYDHERRLSDSLSSSPGNGTDIPNDLISVSLTRSLSNAFSGADEAQIRYWE